MLGSARAPRARPPPRRLRLAVSFAKRCGVEDQLVLKAEAFIKLEEMHHDQAQQPDSSAVLVCTRLQRCSIALLYRLLILDVFLDGDLVNMQIHHQT